VKSQYAYKYGIICDGTDAQLKELGLEGYDYCLDDLIDDTAIDPKYCPYCSGEKVSEREMLNCLLKSSGATEEALKKQILSARKKLRKRLDTFSRVRYLVFNY
jgi:hypothetical protein